MLGSSRTSGGQGHGLDGTSLDRDAYVTYGTYITLCCDDAGTIVTGEGFGDSRVSLVDTDVAISGKHHFRTCLFEVLPSMTFSALKALLKHREEIADELAQNDTESDVKGASAPEAGSPPQAGGDEPRMHLSSRQLTKPEPSGGRSVSETKDSSELLLTRLVESRKEEVKSNEMRRKEL